MGLTLYFKYRGVEDPPANQRPGGRSCDREGKRCSQCHAKPSYNHIGPTAMYDRQREDREVVRAWAVDKVVR
jgi:hypothetical protein